MQTIRLTPVTPFTVLSPWQSHCERSHGSSDICSKQTAADPQIKPTDMGYESVICCYHLRPPSTL